MLSKAQFTMLVQLVPNAVIDKKQNRLQIVASQEIALELQSAGLISGDMKITENGLQALEPYKVKNAVIMAAGMSTRFAPISYEKPKALLEVKGEILIEREIRQLQEAGIKDIIVVVGYLKEQLFYLEDRYGVKIVVNQDYYRYNNGSTLLKVADKLGNTYICSSDNYFVENPFETYVYRPYYSAVYAPGKTEEYCLSYDETGRITGVTVGGCRAWYMLGHAYFDEAFSHKFTEFLQAEWEEPQTRLQLWEDLYMRHLDVLWLYIRKYSEDIVKEFDSLEELRNFDTRYLNNVSSSVFNNICKVLQVSEEEIGDIVPIKKGLTNSSFRFTVQGGKYVYRHPGVGTNEYINRKSEAASLTIARELGLDDTFIYMNEVEGWKISHYVENARNLDYHNQEDVAGAMALLRMLHSQRADTGFFFNLWQEIDKFEERLKACDRDRFADMRNLRNMHEQIRSGVQSIPDRICLCHSDTYDPNFLVAPTGKMYLIDWEYSGMGNRGADLGTFIACSDYTADEAERVIAQYLGHKATPEERCYYISYVAAASYYWFLWAIYQDSLGKNVGEYLYIWYRYSKEYGRRAIELLNRRANDGEA